MEKCKSCGREGGGHWAHCGMKNEPLPVRSESTGSNSDCLECDEYVADDGYCCLDCRKRIIVCANCMTICEGCDCGNCEDGTTFHESD